MQFRSQRLVPLFLETLQSLPSIELKANEYRLPHQFDALLQLAIGARNLTLCVCEITVLSPAIIRNALQQLERFRLMTSFVDSVEHNKGHASLAILSPRISPSMQTALRQARVTFFDPNGTLFLIGHGIYTSTGAAERVDGNGHRPVSCLLQ
jgi:hypothetical protein